MGLWALRSWGYLFWPSQCSQYTVSCKTVFKNCFTYSLIYHHHKSFIEKGFVSHIIYNSCKTHNYWPLVWWLVVYTSSSLWILEHRHYDRKEVWLSHPKNPATPSYPVLGNHYCIFFFCNLSKLGCSYTWNCIVSVCLTVFLVSVT